jgi:hypothetical protein
MSDYQGNIIIKNPATPTGPNFNGSAPGIWTVEQAAYWQRQGLWPTQGVGVPDTYFPYVAMLMSTTATNAQQNNTFLDSSANSFTVNRNGNTTQGSVNPYGTLWSNYFDGSGDYLTVSPTALSTGDFTFECWIYSTGTGQYQYFYDTRASTNDAAGFCVIYNHASYPNKVSIYSNGFIGTPTINVSVNTWTHFALVRSSGSWTTYINGAQDISPTSVSRTLSNTALKVGAGQALDYFFNGNLSNYRIVNGTAVYTSTFTPPTAPLTAISGTSLLTCQSNRFRDASTNNFTLTRNGDMRVTNFSPFSPTYPGYSPSAGVSSIYFDGATDWLNLAGQSAFAYGTGAFTIECWFYALGVGQMIIDGRPTSSNGNYVLLAVGGGGTLEYYSNNVGQVLGNTQIQLGAWNHFAIARSGTTTKMFLNGIENASFSDNTNYEAATDRPIIGTNGYRTDLSHFSGYMSNFRIVKGTAVYTSAFTPPSAPVTAISGTSLLLNATNAGIFDSATINNMETVGNAQVSTVQSKFGGSSLYLDGSGDYLQAPYNDAFQFGTGDFTVEFWINSAASGSYNQVVGTLVSGTENGTWRIGTRFNSLNNLYFARGNGSGFDEFNIAANANDGAWHHVACTRSSGLVRLFLDGTVVSSSTISGTCTSANPLRVGYNQRDTVYVNGYIDDLRITKGVARYTANFTAPTQAFPPY